MKTITLTTAEEKALVALLKTECTSKPLADLLYKIESVSKKPRRPKWPKGWMEKESPSIREALARLHGKAPSS